MPFPLARRELLGGIAVSPIMVNLGAKAAMSSPSPDHPTELVWRRIMDDSSFEMASLSFSQSRPRIAGSVFAAEKGSPLRVDYSVHCDEGWNTLSASVEQSHGGKRRSLRLEHDGRGNWRRNGDPAAELEGCTDVDLGLSPSTNALPINRLRMGSGESRAIKAAWVRFPSLTVEAADQSYERTGERRYRYRNLSSGFTALVDVDEQGLPVDYEGIWRRIAKGTAAPQSARAAFVSALVAPGPSPELGSAAEALGWLVGGWSAIVFDYEPDGAVHRSNGEWWFAWILEGRALQDVWISPDRASRTVIPGPYNRYGTTIRHFDRDEGRWKIAWTNPVSGAVNHLSGQRRGNHILLLGEQDGHPIRWSFNDIRANDFVWRGERRRPNGDWRLEAEFRLRRIA